MQQIILKGAKKFWSGVQWNYPLEENNLFMKIDLDALTISSNNLFKSLIKVHWAFEERDTTTRFQLCYRYHI